MAKIMVVDDAPADLQNLKNILTKGGHQVIEVTSGQDSIAKAKAEKPDAIVMDVVMPGVNGFQATRTLTNDDATRHIPIILVTSKNQETDRVWGMRQGAKDYVTKPVDEKELVAKVAALA